MMNRISGKLARLLCALLICNCTAAVALTGCSGSNNADASLSAQAEPANGTVLEGQSSGNARVEISVPKGESAFVKVKTMAGNTVSGFFVRSGSSAAVDVPAGTYAVQFATGETWYGKGDLFGSRTQYGQDKSVSLREGDVITYTLQLSSNGNFRPQSLNASDF